MTLLMNGSYTLRQKNNISRAEQVVADTLSSFEVGEFRGEKLSDDYQNWDGVFTPCVRMGFDLTK